MMDKCRFHTTPVCEVRAGNVTVRLVANFRIGETERHPVDGIHVAYVVFVCYVVRLLFGVGKRDGDGEGIWKKGEEGNGNVFVDNCRIAHGLSFFFFFVFVMLVISFASLSDFFAHIHTLSRVPEWVHTYMI
ncbi:hypothetical protein ASPFODRAFT_488406 [Aspergillus luchuensis CBS 106.47]|uniref:Uncharacterized protein n=1 Tax=Aspergillus luchuensis (strain CBS 106.47) TaxID=1137211 RepID=A0A1M3TR02_ASPLC|nr:hypothetical protein ASPFODRAFT_488406 [Aspergillus luchuensis CBS 106.47]